MTMDIKKTGINYRYQDDGFTVSRVDISYSAYSQTGDSITATAAVTDDMLGDGVTFDDVTAKQLDKMGRAKIAGWFDEDVAAAPVTTPTTDQTGVAPAEPDADTSDTGAGE